MFHFSFSFFFLATAILQKLGLYDMLDEEIERLNRDEEHLASLPIPAPVAPAKPKTSSNNERLGTSNVKYTQKKTFKPTVNDDNESPSIEELEDRMGVPQKRKQRRIEEYSRKKDENITEPNLDVSFGTLMDVIPSNENRGKGGPYKNKKRKAEIIDHENVESSSGKKLQNKKVRSRKKGSFPVETSSSEPSISKIKSNSNNMTEDEFMEDMGDFDTPSGTEKSQSSKLTPGRQQKNNRHKNARNSSKGNRNNKNGNSFTDSTFAEADKQLEQGIFQAADDLLNEVDDFYDSPCDPSAYMGNKTLQSDVRGNKTLQSDVRDRITEIALNSQTAGKSKTPQVEKDQHFTTQMGTVLENVGNGETETEFQSQIDMQSQIDKAGEELLEEIDFFDEEPGPLPFARVRNDLKSKYDKRHNDRAYNRDSQESQCDSKSDLSQNVNVGISDLSSKESVRKMNRKEGVDSDTSTKKPNLLISPENLCDDQNLKQALDNQNSSCTLDSLQRFAFAGISNEAIKMPWHREEGIQDTAIKRSETEVVSGTPIKSTLDSRTRESSASVRLDKGNSNTFLDSNHSVTRENKCVINKENYPKLNPLQNIAKKSNDKIQVSAITEGPKSLRHSNASSKLQRFSFQCSKEKDKEEETKEAASLNGNHKSTTDKTADVMKMNFEGQSSVLKSNSNVLPLKRFPLLSSQGSTNSGSSVSFVGGAASEELDDIDFELDL